MEEAFPEGEFPPLRLLGKDAYFLNISTPQFFQVLIDIRTCGKIFNNAESFGDLSQRGSDGPL